MPRRFLLRYASDAASALRTLDEAEHLFHNQNTSVASLRSLFGFIPESCSPCLRNGVRFRRNRQLEGIGADPAATLLQPMHLVIRESRDSAVISIVSPAALRTSGVPPVVAIPIHRTLSRLAQALEGAGARRIVTHRVEAVPDDDPVQLRCEEILPR